MTLNMDDPVPLKKRYKLIVLYHNTLYCIFVLYWIEFDWIGVDYVIL